MTISSGTATAERRLSELRAGERAYVTRIDLEGPQRRRLMDLGFVPGTAVTVEFASPLGDPRSYRVRQALIALRDEQARHIVVRPVDTENQR